MVYDLFDGRRRLGGGDGLGLGRVDVMTGYGSGEDGDVLRSG